MSLSLADSLVIIARRSRKCKSFFRFFKIGRHFRDNPGLGAGVGGKTLGFNIPTIPALAAGGVATAPTLAMIGEGGEPEAVLPLSKLAALLDEWNKKPKPGGGPRGGGDTPIQFADVR